MGHTSLILPVACFRRRHLVLLAGLAMATTAQSQQSTGSPPSQTPSVQTSSTPDKEAKKSGAKQLQAVTVTGSRIPRSELEGPSPVTVISSTEIDTRGYRNAFDALSQLSQNTGQTQGQDFGSTFTPAGDFLNLRNLGPNHTLVLVNGHRMAEYPVAYGGSVNAVNLANIPSESIERIEITDPGASAIYGSDAIAGVVNIILKDHYDGTDINVRGGGTQGGGGANQRLQLTQGIAWKKLSGVVGLELNHTQPLTFGDRRLTSSYTRGAVDPTTSVPAVAGITDPVSGRYLSPGAGACQGLSGLFGGSTGLADSRSPSRPGSYCGSDRYYDQGSIGVAKKQASAFASLKYPLGEHTSLYGDFLADETKTVSHLIGPPTWSSNNDVGPFWNADTGRLERWSRTLAPDEGIGLEGFNRVFLDRSGSASIGVKGQFGESDWHYDANYSISGYSSDQSSHRFLKSINGYFLGPQQGTQAFQGEDYPVYRPDPGHLYGPISAADYRALSGVSTSHNTSWTQTASFAVNGTWFELPGGDLATAAVLELGDQGYHNRADPAINQGLYYGTSQADSAGGTRRNQALGVEFNAPLLKSLTLSGAARYDVFHFAGNTISKPTFNLGLEYRPIQSLLLRGSYATSFRAPDMNYIYSNQTRGYEPSVTDYYQCRQQNQPYGSCDRYYNMNYTQTGNARLKPEQATSFTYGLVWSPSHHFDISADYYHIVISNEVTNLSVSQLLQTDADCLLGQTLAGQAMDRGSPLCQDALARVHRNPGTATIDPDQVTMVDVNPINAANERTSGLDMSTNLHWGGSRYGRFDFKMDYTTVFSHKYQQYLHDVVQNQLSLSYQTEWRSKVNAVLNWHTARWSATLSGIRYGKLPLQDMQGYRAPYVLFNGSVGYTFSRQASLMLVASNLGNKMPVDRSEGWPNYPSSVYDIYGRQWWLEFNYHFGGKHA